MRAHVIRGLCAVTAGAAILPLGLAGTAGAAVSPACPAHPVTAYVLSELPGTMTPIRTATNTALTSIKVGGLAYDVVITPNGKTAYVLSTVAVTPISTATNTAGKAIKIRAGTSSGLAGATLIAITPNGKTVYAASPSADTITPISTATGTAGDEISVGSYPRAIAIAR